MHLNFILVALLIFLGSNGLDWLLFLFSLPQEMHFKKGDLYKIPCGAYTVGIQLMFADNVKSTVLVYKLDAHRKSDLHTKHRKKQNHFWFSICLSLASDSTCIFIKLIASWYTISWWRYETRSRELAHSLLRPYLSRGWKHTHTNKRLLYLEMLHTHQVRPICVCRRLIWKYLTKPHHQ